MAFDLSHESCTIERNMCDILGDRKQCSKKAEYMLLFLLTVSHLKMFFFTTHFRTTGRNE